MTAKLDPYGYYACLGVSPTASVTEIRRAYRRRAKELHPDKNPSPNANADFRLLNEAYEVLGDSGKRATYDVDAAAQTSRTAPSSTSASKSEPVEPVPCSQCGKVSAQPRYVVYRYVTSFIIVTYQRAFHGVFCRECATKQCLKASLITWFSGWWGFPWGPIYSIGALFRNLIGGEMPRAANATLLGHQAFAFAQSGLLDLGISAANQAIEFAFPETEQYRALTKFRDALLGMGAQNRKLRNRWHPMAGLAFGAQAAILTVIILLIGALTFQDQGYSRGSSASPRTAGINDWVTPQSTQHAASPLTDQLGFPCDSVPLPYNGQIVARMGSGKHTVQIGNGTNQGALIKLRAESGQSVLSFYVSPNSTAEIGGVPEGSYKLEFATGNRFSIGCKRFLENMRAQSYPSFDAYTTNHTPSYIEYSVWKYTINPIIGGNVRTRPMDVDAFLIE